MSPAAVLSILVTANTAQAQAALARVDAQAKKTAASTTAAGSAMGSKIAKGAKVGALGLAALGAISIKAAADFESSFAEVRKTVDTSEKGFRRLEKGLRGLSKEIPVSVNELNELAGQAGALGIAAKDLVKFTKTAAELGIATDMSSEEAANSLARLSNIMGTAPKNFRRLASTFVDLGNKGASTESEISEMALRIAGTGRVIGLTEPQVLGLAASLANVGIHAEAGGSAISRVMLQMQDAVAKGGGDLQAFADVAGVSGQTFAKEFEQNAPRAIALFASGLGKINKEGGSTIDTLKGVNLNEIRVRDTLLRISGGTKDFTNAQKTANAEWERNSALTKEAQARYKTTAGQAQLLKNKINDLFITVGKLLDPAVKDLLRTLNSFNLEKLRKALGLSKDDMRSLGKAAKLLGGIFKDFLGASIGSFVKFSVDRLRSFAQIVKGIVKVVGGILTGDFGKAWDGVKDIFKGGVNLVIGFLNALIRAINVIPGIPDIGEIGTIGSGGGRGKGVGEPKAGRTKQGAAGKRQHRFMGGAITKPMAIVGEEAPRHHEWVIATNPAYKRDNLRYWAQAGSDLGVPGFAVGGVVGKAISSLPMTGGTPNVANVLAKLPDAKLPQPFTDLGPWLIKHVTGWVKDQFKDKKVGGLTLGPGVLRGSVMEKIQAAIAIGKRHGSGVADLFRPGAASFHNPDYSPPHQAVDLSGGDMLATAKGIIRAFGVGNILELFHNPLGFQVDNYRRGAMTVMDHHDHVHAAFRKGGLLNFLGAFAEGGRMVNATVYGFGEPGTGTQGYKGDYLPGKHAYAELGMGTRLGDLPYKHLLEISRAGKSVVAPKLDIGAGAPGAQIDLWSYTAKALGLGSTFSGKVRVKDAGKGAGGLTEGQKTIREAKARKAAYEQKIAKLRQAVADSKTLPAKQSALWRLIKMWGRVGIFDKGERSHILDAVQRASAQVNPEGRVKILSHLASFAGKAGGVTGRDPDDWHSMVDAIEKAQERGQEQRKKVIEKHKRQRARKAARIADRGNFPGLAKALEGHETAYDIANQGAERLVVLEPENLTDAYVGSERDAWGGVLGTLASWRDRVVTSRDFAAGRIPAWQAQIKKLKELKGKAFKKNKWRIGPLREAITNAQQFISDRHEDLTTLQGVGGPPGVLGPLGENTPHWLTLGGPGATIFDTQNTIRQLSLKGIGGDGGDGDSERASLLEDLLRKANLRNLVFTRQKPIIDRYAGAFAAGGLIPGGKWGVAGERGPEIVHGPARVFSNPESQAMVGADVRVEVYDHTTKVFVNDQEVEAIIRRMGKQQGRSAKTVGARRAGRVG